MITDYAMPHVSGAEFLREARELCPGVPALMITGYADADAISDRPGGGNPPETIHSAQARAGHRADLRNEGRGGLNLVSAPDRIAGWPGLRCRSSWAAAGSARS